MLEAGRALGGPTSRDDNNSYLSEDTYRTYTNKDFSNKSKVPPVTLDYYLKKLQFPNELSIDKSKLGSFKL